MLLRRAVACRFRVGMSFDILEKFREFMKKHHQELYQKDTNASDIAPDDEWMQETIWDDIYKGDTKNEES